MDFAQPCLPLGQYKGTMKESKTKRQGTASVVASNFHDEGTNSWSPDAYMMTSTNGNIFHVTGPLCGEFTGQRPVTRSFDVFFDLRLIKRLSKHSRGWWFETLSRPLWRHCNDMCQWVWSSLIQVMAQRLLGTEPRPGPILIVNNRLVERNWRFRCWPIHLLNKQSTCRWYESAWRHVMSLSWAFLNSGLPCFLVGHLEIYHLIRTWWRHQMETFSALLAFCAGNSPVTGEFPAQRPVTRNFDVFFNLRLNKRLRSNRESGDLRRHRTHYIVIVMKNENEIMENQRNFETFTSNSAVSTIHGK